MTNKRCLIYETLGKVTNLQVSEATAPQGMIRLEGVFGVCGVRNQNNRIYDKKNYAQMVEALQEVIKRDNGCPGELEHPNSMNINLENVSHKIESIQMNEDGTITGTILLLNTPKGQIAQAIVEGGLPLYISSRGAGTITNESGISHVTLSTIKTYDLVGTPGFSQAKLNLKANQTLECLNESADDGNIMYAIVEGDDLLADDSGDDSKDDSKEKDNAPKEDEKDSKDDNKEDTKDDNKNNNKKVDMKELKDAIDKLTAKVESLEAGLHVAQESLEDINSIQPTNYDAIQRWVTEEFWPEYSNQISEGLDMDDVESLIQNKVNEAMAIIAEGVQGWVTEEFAPEVQSWVCEEFAPEVQSWVCEEFAPEVQSWVCEEFAPEVQNWIVEEFAPEVQSWICEEFAPEVQNWIVEEYSSEVQNWIVEEYSPEVQNWIVEEYSPVVEGWITEEYSEEHLGKINEIIESQKAGRLDEIDSLLESIAQDDNADVNKIVKEQQVDNKWKGFYVVENMPSEYVPMWHMLSEARQQEIVRSSKMYDFTKAGVLESFWANIDFNKTEQKQVNENYSPTETYQSNIVTRMKALRGYNV